MPLLGRVTTTRFGIVWPRWSRLRFDESGRGEPPGKTVTKPPLAAWVAVTLRATADALAGTVPTPPTCTVSVEPAAGMPMGAPMPLRVSRTRNGVSGTNFDRAPGPPASALSGPPMRTA